MKRISLLVISISLLCFGCTTAPPVAQLVTEQLWNDQYFNYKANDVIETKETLFALDPELSVMLASKRHEISNPDRRLEYLASILFRDKRVQIDYTTGHSTGAAETWQKKRGDCLSLTLLTHSASNALGIAASMQDIRVPVAVDRRSGIDYVSGHVNLYVENRSELMVGGQSFPPGGVFIDFAPQIGSRRHGKRLSEDQIVARFYNNRASEYLAAKSDSKAYAYYRAALTVDPTFAPAYGNLAQLYARHGLVTPAENLLRYAMALNDESDAPMRTLHALLVAQDRTDEAAKLAVQLRERQNEDPYYWIGIGLDHLQNRRYSKAIDSLERAEVLTTGFEEVHRYLAIAYWRNGQQRLADKELSMLTAMLTNDPSVKALSAKLNHSPSEVYLQ